MIITRVCPEFCCLGQGVHSKALIGVALAEIAEIPAGAFGELLVQELMVHVGMTGDRDALTRQGPLWRRRRRHGHRLRKNWRIAMSCCKMQRSCDFSMARRPAQIPARAHLSDVLIESATYAGSGEHKVGRWWGGLPQGRVGPEGKASRPRKQKTTICPLTNEEDRKTATMWVRGALKSRQYRYYEGDKDFPKHIWYYANGQTWFGYCINGIAGQYKGWPVEEDERRAVFD